ncbi:unnamed protein product [Paramecium sonneborni]|uniref:Protein kinase domain-containing protein n=1 Tax=Paramecium sonneborni TaxID=65129 RepID=A0A8S1LUE2_9CILI|nr:unnamed protein product [Paramecium sonneborni]
MQQFQLTIKDFDIDYDSRIGKGQYGEVFSCKCKKIPNLELCAKILQHNPNLKEYQESEIQISEIVSQNKDNPNLVKIYLAKKEGDQLIIIMEKCESNLQKLWEQKKQFSDYEIEEFLVQFLNGYEILYRNKIIHRDIKPENILIKYENGKPIYKLADFGIGKTYKSNDYVIQRVGTPAYAAPETNQLLNDEELQTRFLNFKKVENAKSSIDIFPVGVILYQMVFGSFPYNNKGQLTQDHIKKFFQSIKNNPIILPESQSQISGIIQQILVYYPENRMTFQYLYQIFEQLNQRVRVQDPFQQIQQTPNFKQPSNFVAQKQFNSSSFPQQTQFQQQKFITPQPKPLPNQFVTPSIQIQINPFQTIKQHIQYILNDYSGLLNDTISNTLSQFYNFNGAQFSSKDLVGLFKFFKFQIDKLNSYESKTLTFIYSILISIQNPNQNQVVITDDQTTRETIRTIWKYFIDNKLL